VGTTPDRFFQLADGLGCRHASLNATFPLDSMSLDEITEHYAAICQRAREHGMNCDLEFIPLWGVPTLQMAWDIVKGAGAANGGLVFDVWHYVRGGSKMDLLRQIPGDQIHCVQLNDGPLELPYCAVGTAGRVIARGPGRTRRSGPRSDGPNDRRFHRRRRSLGRRKGLTAALNPAMSCGGGRVMGLGDPDFASRALRSLPAGHRGHTTPLIR